MDERRVLRALEECRGVREARARCASYPWARYCVYTYKTADWRVFKSKPCLLYSRGTVLVEDRSGGTHVILPFTKFFNAGETEYTLLNRLSRLSLGSVYEKLDGTLVNVWIDPVTGDIRATTRGSLWSHPGPGEDYDREGRVVNPYSRGFMRFIEGEGLRSRLTRLLEGAIVAMFELVVPGMPASMMYGRPDEHASRASSSGLPYLLAYRGRDWSIREPAEVDWPLAPARLDPSGGPRALMGRVEEMGAEGAVAWFRDSPYEGPFQDLDPLVKFKSRSYLLRVTGLQSKRSILAYTLQGGLDDIAGYLSPGEIEVLRRIYEEYQRLAEVLEELRARREVLRRRGIMVRGLIATALERPEALVGELVSSAPRDYGKALRFLVRLRATAERILAKL